ncbi:uncharacterized protein EV422DRAFT_564152 [Fimicolochytrium jonesii]|uniref:uncharacterized protein n=1 Tax=Fimicolochytrium jonesii TaxID=1396493 RepID=UPI0022FDBA70|nr:uncharacterized protein EV422DRAFT_564152 [Fimicolochytrium jonesii]KAI8824832.1 hypothetical protein EV422DRAFT_564152 [Fimicolochytrium jonesii]
MDTTMQSRPDPRATSTSPRNSSSVPVDTRRDLSAEELLESAPAVPDVEPGATQEDASVQQAIDEEGVDALQNLKEVSLQALGVLLRRLVDEKDSSPQTASLGNTSHQQQGSSSSPSSTLPPQDKVTLSEEEHRELKGLVGNLPPEKISRVKSILGRKRAGSSPQAPSPSIQSDANLAIVRKSTLKELYSFVKGEDANASVSKLSAKDLSAPPKHTGQTMLSALKSKVGTMSRSQSSSALVQDAASADDASSNKHVTDSSHTTTQNDASESSPIAPLRSSSFSSVADSDTTDVGHDLLTDHGLALAIAALCNGLYRILDVNEIRNSEAPQGGSTDKDAAKTAAVTDTMFAAVTRQMSAICEQRNMLDRDSLQPEQRALWEECERLMSLVRTIVAARQRVGSAPPSYEEALVGGAKGSAPNYSKRDDELSRVISAIDRVMYAAPRLDNQSVQLNARQEKVMSAAALGAMIERLNRGKEDFDAQRATSSQSHRYAALQNLVDQLAAAGERSMSDQRVTLSTEQSKRIEMGKLSGILDRQEKTRFKNQDAVTREQRLLNDLSHLTNSLTKPSPQFAAQRYEVSSEKQRDMFLSSLGARLQRTSERRMGNQDAMAPSDLRDIRIAELEKIMDRIPQGLKEQRASYVSAKDRSFHELELVLDRIPVGLSGQRASTTSSVVGAAARSTTPRSSEMASSKSADYFAASKTVPDSRSTDVPVVVAGSR